MCTERKATGLFVLADFLCDNERNTACDKLLCFDLGTFCRKLSKVHERQHFTGDASKIFVFIFFKTKKAR